MAKQSFPMMKTGGGVLPKLFGWAVLIVVVVMVVQQPTESAEFVKTTFGALKTFFGAVAG
ncbi:hypothetical protein A8924_0871 [Saccharopolyspora erythraea NRRL 2338]|uniref:Uncharacterized protein n=2 Tax=Saccharopolyspora erythraea TaxID=1836 RepID=A4F6Z8_SACEN|nr:hypothetical protein [Saccharopolyspora erythraea]EQD83125.1 hypothetical protein N599_26950 [Saccharopolyspora erythraea D]PFG93621.1 hypothetical protein A8924_0871 [Saccharopolyspora erythraea NRRL 2338]QRK90240.1 hypothetical protein JQX30_01355 [Saccharopolyspora erythraea]QRK90466.1 hypothetical protein JQX30_02860 [Saccharopolyspora erythraea]QRK90476.1 hypothetical protein JQX30_02930 [Saccharopolyspora erythraea]